MNRRDFIKTTGAAAITASPLSSFGQESLETNTGTTPPPHLTQWNWDYRVYCYERGQGEWTFSQNTRGSFAYQRESVLEEDNSSVYAGWMDGGKLHFVTLEEAQDFVDMHIRAKDDTNLIDSIYDIYYIDRDNLEYESCQPTEIKVAHYWFNGDTGRQIEWVSKKPYTNYSKIECA